MIRELARTEVSEFAVVTDRLPCIKVGGAFQPIDDHAPNTDAILEMLVSTGGSRYVDSLGPKASQWSWKVEGLGTVAVTALMKNNLVQARFVLSRREGRADKGKEAPAPPPAPAPPAAARPPPAPAPAPPAPAAARAPRAAATRTCSGGRRTSRH